MPGETDLKVILKKLRPEHNMGDFVFCVINDLSKINLNNIILLFREKEGFTIVLEQQIADSLKLEYTFIGAWITLSFHSALNAVGLTAAFSKALSEHDISCNVIAGFYHDHIFVEKKDANKAMIILNKFSE